MTKYSWVSVATPQVYGSVFYCLQANKFLDLLALLCFWFMWTV
jgi:hypothetical protein